MITLQKLDLSDNHLTSFIVLSTLTNLQKLDLSANRLTSFIVPSTLTALRKLDLTLNKLTFFTVPPTLTALEELHLSGNNLTSFTIPSTLTALKGLYLSNNQLTSIPTEIGAFFLLIDLYILNNPQLETLPMSLGEISGLTHLHISGTLVSEEMKRSILALTEAKRTQEAAERLAQLLSLWSQYAQIPVDCLSSILTFEARDKIAVHEWLTRLARASDFTQHQKALAKTVTSMLKDASKEPFKEAFLTQINANNANCEDRAAMALNELYVAWRVLCPQEESSSKEKLEVVLGIAKTLALRVALAKALQTRPKEETLSESVEIYLYYETTMREELGLLTAVHSMTYTRIGRKNWINEAALKKAVEETYLDHAVTLPIFDSLFNKDPTTKNKLDAIANLALEQLDNDPRPAGDDDSPDVLDWKIRVNQREEARKSEVKELQKAWLQKQMRQENLCKGQAVCESLWQKVLF